MIGEIFLPRHKTKRVNIENIEIKKYLVANRLESTYLLYIYILNYKYIE
jgi:hypothetical protein